MTSAAQGVPKVAVTIKQSEDCWEEDGDVDEVVFFPVAEDC
jgi:hypothetical protein